jgi:putative ABC transport system substrate-binding protein
LVKDDREAVRLYQLAVDQGYVAAQANLGRFYQFGRGGLPQSDRDAARLYQLAAQQGNVAARANLGFFYETGRGGIPQDEVEAARLYRLAAEQGGPFARNQLATFYEEGRGGLPKDNREAARLYKLVSEQDDNLIQKQRASDALTRLGLAPAVASASAPPGVQPAIPVIGFLDTTAPSANRFGINAFRLALKEAGYIEGKNIAIEFRWTNNGREMRELAADMVRRHVDLIVASGSGLAAVAAKAATDTVPIVITGGTDPVQAGWVKSLNRPGGNVTGVTSIHNQLAGKRLAILLDLVPVTTTTIGYLVGVNGSANEDTKGLLEAARSVGREVIVIECRGDADLEGAFEKLAQRQAGGLIVSAFPLAFNNRNKVVALAARYKIPTIYAQSPYAYEGGLISYMGIANERDLVNQYVTRILKGDKPADLPIQTPHRFELILNLRTAKSLGLTISETLLATADKVVE